MRAVAVALHLGTAAVLFVSVAVVELAWSYRALGILAGGLMVALAVVLARPRS